jgi:hypothetical protein
MAIAELFYLLPSPFILRRAKVVCPITIIYVALLADSKGMAVLSVLLKVCPSCRRPISEANYLVRQSVADTSDSVKVLAQREKMGTEG